MKTETTKTATLTPASSHYLCLRASKLGRSTAKLTRAGFWREDHASPNNRNGVDFVLPCGSKGLADHSVLFSELKMAGFVGEAFILTGLQRKYNAAMTDRQWQNRAEI